MTFKLMEARPLPSGVPGRVSLVGAASWLLETAGVVLMAALSLLVLANATGRYFLNHPLPWTEEAVSILLVWIAAVGVVLAAGRGALVGCEIVTSRLNARNARTLARAISFVSALLMLAVAWFSWRYMNVFGRDVTPMLDIPKSWISGGLLAAALGMAAAFLFRTVVPHEPVHIEDIAAEIAAHPAHEVKL
ncbi:TRAP transporter small permease [Ancylobacter oerskovii]|uniref:TRAP transporter small permease protein n=1 Tax=Ancylobacter oerskovii TaxID=459519 RepID=A0ABW4Z303_9HYPH|nr:TRAP transporter small permease [Ancylobacter oerskovii]MBS7546180.1 TRAP transporter small permease [Ancylobacter oerskovii]